jgi:hypothetical protein
VRSAIGKLLTMAGAIDMRLISPVMSSLWLCHFVNLKGSRTWEFDTSGAFSPICATSCRKRSLHRKAQRQWTAPSAAGSGPTGHVSRSPALRRNDECLERLDLSRSGQTNVVSKHTGRFVEKSAMPAAIGNICTIPPITVFPQPARADQVSALRPSAPPSTII